MSVRHAIALLASLFLASTGCAPAEHSILLEARSQGYVESIQITVIDLSGNHPPSRSSPRPVRRTMTDIETGEPIRIAVPLPGPMRAMIHLVAIGRDPSENFVATRCYDVTGVTFDEVLLVGPLGRDFDADGDAFPTDPGATCRDPGTAGTTVPCDYACTRSEGEDCDDNDPSIFPGAPELCRDGIDQDCDGRDAECEDRDGDSWRSCTASDPRGTCDCDDNVATIHPGAEEICRDGIDQDCDGRDGACDQDGDGFPADRDIGGSPDCDDTDPLVFPGATEVCTPRDDPEAVARDEDCNGFIDDAPDCTDDDLDRDGSPACVGLDPSMPCVRTDCDCNDCDAAIHPAAFDRCGNGIDEDQSGADSVCPEGDLDFDGFAALSAGGADCDDTRADVYPGAPDRCGDGVAQNCDRDVSCDGNDGDMDGYLPPSADCDDNDMSRFPGAVESCNSVDDDCDGTTNEVLATPMPGYAYGTTGCVLGDTRLGSTCAGSNACVTDFSSSVFHCGGCRVQCNQPGGLVVADACENGTCDCSAEPGIMACTDGASCCSGAGCRDLRADFDNCGFCGRSCSVASNACSNGECVCGSLGRPCDDRRDGGGTCCGEGCTNTQTDPNNCGACGNVCGANSFCSSGRCTCATGFADCDGNRATGCEIDTRNDVNNCSTCRNACTRTGASSVCTGGTCRIGVCNASRADCDGIDMNGCETSLTTLTNCGGCNVSCVRANATATCGTGTCAIATCNPGFADCDGVDANGCETPVTTLTNCGTCRNACGRANATATCATGSCAIMSCNPGYGSCDGSDGNGCETPLDSLSNCTACGVSCARANATASCASGSCRILTCNAGFGNCDGIDSNGCETPLDTITNCATCGMTCSHPNAVSSCASRSCELSSCVSGYGNCDGVFSNGCETSTTTLTNCGTCGTSCSTPNATPTCATGACMVMSCDPGFGNCDGGHGNGCESPLNTVSNCGGCGIPCVRNHAMTSCALGSCEITSCMGNFDDCDGVNANGCETNLRTDEEHCGVCGNNCGPRATCGAGTCLCDVGFSDCDAAPGCELPTHDDPSNCGGCGITCSVSQTCVDGSCM